MKHGSLFSGIGGFDLAAQWMGWENVFHCEINKFCNKILKQHFPYAQSYTDITTTDFSEWKGTCDIVSGGFPCQPYSTAGKRKGKEDDRHLWPEMLRAIKQIQPAWIVGENVPGLLNWNGGMVLAEIYADLEAAGFEVFPPCILPACGKNAPHRRDRLWIVGYSAGNRRERQGKEIENENGQSGSTEGRELAGRFKGLCCNGNVADTPKIGRESSRNTRTRGPGFENSNSLESWIITDTDSDQRCKGRLHKAGQQTAERYTGPRNALGNEWRTWQDFPTQSPVCGGNDGISNRVDRIKALGNSVVPQVVFEIFKSIEAVADQWG
jgi:DNA (cytosine-5)-methyltransferase 1